MFDLFGVPWEELEAEHVEAFLADAVQEGVTWEAKADDERASLRPDSIRKAACGLANQIGGYVIIGARRPKGGEWELPGISPLAEEMELWVGQVLRDLRPTPRFEVKVWPRPAEKVAAVVAIEPVAVPPCMTSQGRIYERVSGETLPVEDPALLDRLFRRGADARARAAALAPQAARRAIDASGWRFQKSVGVAVGIAPQGRETDDISSRLFLAETRKAMVEATWALMQALRPMGQPDDVAQEQRQDSHAALIHFSESTNWDANNEPVSTNRSTWLTQANWDGSVAASLTLSDGDIAQAPPVEELIRALWRVIVPLCARLGGYGPSELGVIVAVTKSRNSVVEGDVANAPGRPPPENSLYTLMPEETQMGRVVDLTEPDEAGVASLGRETRRSGGEIQDEA